MALTQPAQLTTAFAHAGLKNDIPQAATGSNLASYEEGFPSVTMQAIADGGTPPQGQDFNGVLYTVTDIIRYLQAGAVYPYNAAFCTAIGGYPLGALLSSADGTKLYINQVNGNTNNPDTNSTNWQTVLTNSLIDAVPTVGSTNPVSSGGVYAALEGKQDTLPSQTGKAGQYLQTDGTDVLWSSVDALPPQAGKAGKYLQTDGTDASWENGMNGRSILEVFYTMRTDAGPINGAYDANGMQYAKSDFTGAQNPYDLLVAGKAPTCSFAEFESIVSQYGSCGYFALDTVNEVFRVPLLKNVIQATVLVSEVGDVAQTGLASGGVSLKARPMVQLATAGEEVSIQQYQQQLADYAQAYTLNGRIVGEYIWSGLPLVNAGVHLLDGSQIMNSGIYAQFCTYVQGLQSSYPDIFCTEDEFSQSVATYGSCGKFVIGDNYIRLPKVSDILQGTTDTSALGDLIEAGLPNITGNMSTIVTSSSPITTGGLSSTTPNTTNNVGVTGEKYWYYSSLHLDASRSNPIYGNSTTVQQQAIKALLYICVANATKTEIEVDIDNIVTDLNSKQDKMDAILYVASIPGHFSRMALPVPNRTSITVPAGMSVNIGSSGYALTSSKTLNLADYATAANRAGKDMYIYAVVPTSGSQPDFVLSLNSTVPDGYTSTNSRKIGGFHCLCANVGTISGHTLSGYNAGDILPLSVWDLKHRAKSENEGMVYVNGLWVDIYLASWSGSKVQSVYGGTCLDGDSSINMHGEKFAEFGGLVSKRLPKRDEYLVFAKGSNEKTNISGSSDAGTTGGHSDTAGRRMVSNYGIEDCCGFMWQWTSDIFGAFNTQQTGAISDAKLQAGGINNTAQTATASGNHYLNAYSWQDDGRGVSNTTCGETMGQYGMAYGALARSLVGGNWGDGSRCGSRSVRLNSLSSDRIGNFGGRFASEPRSISF